MVKHQTDNQHSSEHVYEVALVIERQAEKYRNRKGEYQHYQVPENRVEGSHTSEMLFPGLSVRQAPHSLHLVTKSLYSQPASDKIRDMPNAPKRYRISDAAKLSGYSRQGFYYFIKSRNFSTRYEYGVQTISKRQLQEAIKARCPKRERSKTAEPEWVSVQFVTS